MALEVRVASNDSKAGILDGSFRAADTRRSTMSVLNSDGVGLLRGVEEWSVSAFPVAVKDGQHPG